MYDIDSFYGPNAGYVLELYERYRQNPASVDPDTRAIFENWTPPSLETPSIASPAAQPATQAPAIDVSKIVALSNLAHAIRSRGHLGAHLDPLESEPLGDPALQLEYHGLSEADLAQLPPEVIGGHSAEGARNALEALANLRAMYSGTISYELDQVKSSDERRWLRDAVGLYQYRLPPGRDVRYRLLQRLTQVEAFERFLHTTFPGQKRFSLEGNDVLVPMLDEVVHNAVRQRTQEVIIGMAHRGRLNVLAHVLEKPYAAILSEFRHMKHEEGVPLTDTFGFGYTGDVKYHLGAEHVLDEEGTPVHLKITLSPNPSHLEFVNPVVEGMTRASQEIQTRMGSPDQDYDHTLPVLIHGDAAFPGEGIVAETLNLWNLQGYRVGGTIHIILNNQLGFTTEPSDSRSTHFASDLAKGFEIPIIHVNADDPEAALMAVRLADAYRTTFHKDILVDLVGYRRWGHNEGDEPAFTQPQMYEIIRAHPSVRELYAQRLQEQGILTAQDAEAMQKQAVEALEEARRAADESPQPLEQDEANGLNGHYEGDEVPPPVPAEVLKQYNSELLQWPADFSPNNKLARLLKRHEETLEVDGGIDWGQAEALAFASILADGTSIRLMGQDSERGTFSHRHAVLHDQHSGKLYIPLQHLAQANANFSIFNSPLNESASLAFEYGYSVHAPAVLTLWEAQFGDFANVAQVIIDQFIASARAKWKQLSSLVLLLPHGYEGQGPEHSSARLERYLELSAQDNWRVADVTTAAQYFHLLRMQAFYLQRYPRPLVIMTPKSLLRHPLAAANLRELSEGKFQPVLNDRDALRHADAIRRVVLCTGKIAIDLLSNAERARAEDVAIVRVEMLYPFPADQLRQVLASYPNAREVVWVQEEPENMGAWEYIAPRLPGLLGSNVELAHISRPARSSPATGFSDLFQLEQEQIIKQALHTSVKSTAHE